jgi:hypothetical protein
MTLHACQKWFTISSHITLRRMTSSQIRCKEFSTGSNEPSSTVLIDYFKVLGIEVGLLLFDLFFSKYIISLN